MNILDCFNQSAPFIVRAVTSCQSSAQFLAQILRYLASLASGTKNYAHATTITIGNKYYGSMSAKKQYKYMYKAIRQHITDSKRASPNCKLFYTFELQKNGQLHAHGIELGTWHNNFCASFSKFGRRNLHNASFQELKRPTEYLEYITKEEVFPRIHNITKKSVKTFIKTLSKEGGEGERSSPLSEERSSTNLHIIKLT